MSSLAPLPDPHDPHGRLVALLREAIFHPRWAPSVRVLLFAVVLLAGYLVVRG